ncbi:MAG: zinc ABC transporter substrate-binding protein [Corynebacterium sp.]|nr:zinc ABC transporter substrate-binding protein [Corynebacterium sp.]
MKMISISAVLVAAGLALTGCSGTQTASDTPTTQADGTIEIVATTQTWADVAHAVAPNATVTTIITGGSEDPHEYEPSVQDMQAIDDADIVVVNGAGYDQWAYTGKESDPRFVFAQKPGTDPDLSAHVFFDTANLTDVATEVAALAGETDPTAVTDRLADFTARLQQAGNGVGVMQTETVADYIITTAGMRDLTPAGYREASLKEEETAAADLDAFLTTIASGEVKVLFANPDTASGTTDRILQAAKDAGVTIIEIGETPSDGQDFLDYFDSIITELTNATAV